MSGRSPELGNRTRVTTTALDNCSSPFSLCNDAGELERSAQDMMPGAISPREFLRFQALIYGESGIWLSEAKAGLLTGRLSKRLRALGLKRFSEYYDRVIADQEEQWMMLDLITTNETHFFREPVHFQFLEQCVFPGWQAAANAGRRPRKIRVWSAGCSTGQEPYSLAMILVDHFPPSRQWSIEILATDLSRRALAIAEQGVWSVEKAHEIPRDYLRAYTLKGVGDNQGKIRAAPSICLIRFMRLNLNDAVISGLGQFDLIFCRNVLIYFDAESRRRLVDRLVHHLAGDGLLFLGHAETLNGMRSSLQCVAPTVYARGQNWSGAKHANGK